MASASNQPLIFIFKPESINKTVGHQAEPLIAASSSKKKKSTYGKPQKKQEHHARLKSYEDEIKTIYNPRSYRTNMKAPNINFPSPRAPLILPSELKMLHKTFRSSLSISKAGRKTVAPSSLDVTSISEPRRIDSRKTLNSQLELQMPFLAQKTRDRNSIAYEHQASSSQHDRYYMEEGESLGQETCPIAVLATYVPVESYKMMMEQHPTRPVVRSSTYWIPPATDYGMLWYLVRDEGCRLEHAFSIVRYVCPNVSRTTRELVASFLQPGYQNSYNYLMDISFTDGVRYIDYYPDQALQQYWVSPILKEGINKFEERRCAYLLSASVCVCAREERVLARIFRHLRRKDLAALEYEGDELGFEDDDFKKLKGSVLVLGGECACPWVRVCRVSG